MTTRLPIVHLRKGFSSDDIPTNIDPTECRVSYFQSGCSRGGTSASRTCYRHLPVFRLPRLSGREVTLHCATGDSQPEQVVRVCETSSMLGTRVACVYQESLANAIVHDEETPVTFTCPTARDDSEPGGYVSFYVAPVSHTDPLQFVNCTTDLQY